MSDKNQLINKELNSVHNMLVKCSGEILKVLPKHVNLERLSRIALTECRKNPGLLKCDILSLVSSVMICGQLGLEPGTELGQCYLLPFYNSKTKQQECQFVLGYRGMITLGRNSGDLVAISAHCAYSNDFFELEFGVHENIRHIPNFKDRGEFIGSYCVAKLKNDAFQFNFIEAKKILDLKESVLSKIKLEYQKYSPWVTAFEEMAAKTAIRRLYKYLPISVELQRAIALDEAAERQQQYAMANAEFNLGNMQLIQNDSNLTEINNAKLEGVIKELEA